MRMWIKAPIVIITGAFLLTLLLGIQPALAEIEQSGRSGQPLTVFCNVAPELSTQRSDSVDNWVRICSLWLNHSCKVKMPKGKKANYQAAQPKQWSPRLPPRLPLTRH